MKIKRTVFAIIIIGIIFIPILLYYFGKSNFSQESIYELNWDIEVPSNIKAIYHNQDEHDFQGKGKRYTLLETNEIYKLPLVTVKDASKGLQTYDGSSSQGRNYEIEEFVQSITTDLKVPENKSPKFDRYYVWQKFVIRENVLIVLYYPNDFKIYFIEKLF
jgi:hypothetical protein